jgi:DNA-binding response OmpR family regulator
MQAARGAFNILMVEDTIEYATLNLMVLKKAGFRVQHAPDGEVAIRLIDAGLPDVLLLDLNLPRVSGWDVLKHVYSNYGEKTVRIIVTTAFSDSANRLVGKLQQVDRYLTKPFTPQDLIRTLDEVLGIQV